MEKNQEQIQDSITTNSNILNNAKLPKEFKLSGIKSNIKYKNRFDLALIYSKEACEFAGVWTQNKIQAACIKYNKNNAKNKIQAIMINSGYANACTGQQGDNDCKECADNLAKILKIDSKNILLASTGVIGQRLPMDRIIKAIPKLVNSKDSTKDSMKNASKAIMTTDTFRKVCGVKFILPTQDKEKSNKTKNYTRIWGMAKGSGMIHPNMATMLGFILTDALIDRDLLQEALSEIVKETFNQISVDGDTSTNDMVVVLANGESKNIKIDTKNKDYELFKDGLRQVCIRLAKQIARDGEGATHLLEVEVKQARTLQQAQKLSKAIIGSNLVKTAIFGKDANWGRIICAMGYSDTEFDITKLNLSFESKNGKVIIAKNGVGVKFNENKAKNILSAEKIKILIDLKDGEYNAKAWGCDLSYDYIKINADYRS